MLKAKSIENIILISSMSSLVIVLLFVFGNITFTQIKNISAIVFTINVFIALFLANSKRLKLFLSVFLLTLSSYFVIYLKFRKIRDYFPKPNQNGEIIGFSQYFGYPYLFDTILFIALILIPISFYFVLKNKINDK